MNISSITTNLMVENVSNAVAFYKKYFGFELLADVPEGDGEKVFAIVKSGEVLLMFQEERSLKDECPWLKKFSPGEGTFTLYINVDDVQALYENVKAKLEVVKDLHTTFYGATEFAVLDCNGYALCFAQRGNA